MAAPQQPDFVSVNNGFASVVQGLGDAIQGIETIRDDLAYLANIPAVQQGNAILLQLAAINHQLTHLVANTHNLRASHQNAVREVGDPLIPLHNVTTNLPIPHFPATPAAINNLPAPILNTILLELQLPATGSVARRKRLLRIALGLPKDCAE
ncbi:hypothetical protein FKW77_002608 [Venturia effusa]|uniref:Uncharacterized protein n=1 Tax=Venturia effusa TaxID=50376 RepID=A0A517LMD4_9PEZI|nr:hypothetical protein FKW77_002608 [Venturia effusa]